MFGWLKQKKVDAGYANYKRKAARRVKQYKKDAAKEQKGKKS